MNDVIIKQRNADGKRYFRRWTMNVRGMDE